MIRKLTLPLIAVCFLLIGLLIYSNALKGEFVFDDFEYIVDNPLIRDFSNFSMSDPRQIGYLSFALNYAVGGDNPQGYHIANVVIHVINAFLVFVLVGTFLAAVQRREKPDATEVRLALLTALRLID